MRKHPQVICEIANSHGGKLKSLIKTIKSFSNINYPDLSIKFQIFSAQGLSVKNFHAHNLYKKLCFDEAKWRKILKLSKSLFNEVWIDVFDEFSLKVLYENQTNIDGLKLQASTLKNNFLLEKISSFAKNKSKKVILNISGFEIFEIKQIIKKLNIKEKNLIIQLGYQDYPTLLDDSGLNKIKVLKRNFKNELCYADHTGKDTIDTFIAPLFAFNMGCDYLEKHICYDYKKTKYDLNSSLDVKDFQKFASSLISYSKFLKDNNFITKKEKKYLSNSILKPVSKKNFQKNSFLSCDSFDFKRTDSKIKSFCDPKKFYFTKRKIKREDILDTTNLIKVKIGVIVGARMKSSRLKKKATLKINRKKSIMCCLDSASKIENIDKFILATSYLKEDDELAKIKHKKFEVFKGEPENLVKRYYDVAKKNRLDTVIRITGDCPYVSKEIINILLRSHLENKADYTSCKKSAHGTAAEIYSFKSLEKIYKKAKSFEHSEYMTWYVMNNKSHFKINLVKLPSQYVRNYRMTLDYKQDLVFFNKLYLKLEKKNMELNLHNIFKILDKEKNMNKINSNCNLVWQTDKNLIEKLNLTTRF